MSYLVQPIQIVLVFDNAAAFDQHFETLGDIEPRLKKALQSYGHWQSLKGFNTPNHLGLATDSRHITLQRFDEKMGMQGFSDVLANPFYAHAKPGLIQAIKDHQRAFLIEVGAGSVPGFANALMASGVAQALDGLDGIGMGLSDDQDGYEERLRLAQDCTSALIREMAPSAVHWAQSQQLFDAPTFTDLAVNGFSLPLYCGPFLFGGEQMPDGSVKAGVRGLGSQNILGKMVVFEPDVQDWTKSYVQMLSFITYCRSIGRILGDKETMSADDADAAVIRVSHKSDIPQLPDGYIALSVDGRTRSDMRGGIFRRLIGKFAR